MVFPILGSGDSSSGYDIEYSQRFDPANAEYLQDWTMGFTATSTTTGTISFWAKPSFYSIGGANTDSGTFISHKTDTNNYIYFRHKDDGDTGQLLIYGYLSGSVNINLLTTQVFRDPSAWYHFVLVWDTTQNTDTNRIKLYVNGVQITVWSTATWPAQNAVIRFSDPVERNVGRRVSNNSSGYNYWAGYISDFNLVDGLALTPSNFGETDSDSGIWKPKEPDVSEYGAAGMRLEFKQTGTTHDASGMGADTSGKGNHMSVQGSMSADNRTTDTPTNNFCTLNPLDRGSQTTLREGNTKYTGGTTSGDGHKQMAAATFGAVSGKWYFEVKKGANDSGIGIVAAAREEGQMEVNNLFTSNWNGFSKFIYTSDGNGRSGNASSSYGSAIHTNDILGFAIDLDNGAMYVSDNGTYIDSGDPTSGASRTGCMAHGQDIFAYHAGRHSVPYWIMGFIGDGGSAAASVAEFNWGNPGGSFSISSGNADANGYGNFEYAPPSGYYACCSKNLAEYG